MKLKSTRPPRKPDLNERSDHMPPIRVSKREKKLIEKQAQLFTGGNVSEWIRYSALNFKPRKEDFEC